MFAHATVLGLIAGALAFLAAPAAEAGPCGRAPPTAGVSFRGPVLHVSDGRHLCVARGEQPDQWVELELDDAPQGTARGALMAVAFARDVDCRMADDGRAVCLLDGASVGRLVRQPQAARAGEAWR